jgi:hypothetical protein
MPVHGGNSALAYICKPELNYRREPAWRYTCIYINLGIFLQVEPSLIIVAGGIRLPLHGGIICGFNNRKKLYYLWFDLILVVSGAII